MLADFAGHLQYVLQVCRAVLPHGGPHGDKGHLTLTEAFFQVGAEKEGFVFDVSGHHGLQPGFINGDYSFLKVLDLFGVHVHAGYPVAHFRKAGPAYQAHIARSNYCKVHR